ncbi:MurR/RpiR family transcriptional regulator [Desulfopila sp. IMCC35008]|uniref:MurR/RpiR family transcriptional regulator n=1 Tax=Desulfopila sp. IMCC35008 TaxID=2653858 RepID=UPI0013D14A6E|nr:MurR/RpiR family transcriptional regulator [Desulfopila sp. IMCC35008]
MNLVEAIASRYQDFTANEKRIFNLMSSDVKNFALYSIGDIATRLEISKTTLMRFAKSCGFNGYSEFKKALQQEVLLDSSPVCKMKKVISEGEDFDIEEICRQEQANITTTFDVLDETDLSRISDLLVSGRNIYTLSWGVSTTIAEIFALRMKLMGIRCTPISRRHGTLIEETSLLRKNDLVLVFEIPPYNREVIEAVKNLSERKITLVLITDSPRCPISKYAEIAFSCATNARFFGNSLTGPLFWVNLVSSLVIYREKDRVLEILEQQQKIFNDERYYHQ